MFPVSFTKSRPPTSAKTVPGGGADCLASINCPADEFPIETQRESLAAEKSQERVDPLSEGSPIVITPSVPPIHSRPESREICCTATCREFSSVSCTSSPSSAIPGHVRRLVVQRVHRRWRGCRRWVLSATLGGLALCGHPGLSGKTWGAPAAKFPPGLAHQETDQKARNNSSADRGETQETPPLSTNSPSADPGPTKDLTFDDLKFEMEVGSKFTKELLTEKIWDLNGKSIRIRGFIRPAYSQTGLTKFVFVRDNQECCFGPGAALYDCILVELASGQETEYTLRPITIKGTFYLRSYKGPDGEIWAIYRMRDTVVE